LLRAAAVRRGRRTFSRRRAVSHGDVGEFTLAVSRERETSTNVVAGEVGEVVKDLAFGHPRGELIEDVVDRDAKAANTGFPTHLARLNRDDLAVVHSPTSTPITRYHSPVRACTAESSPEKAAAKGSTAIMVKVFAGKGESLDPMEIFKKAAMFTFSTGTYEDVLKDYFAAETKGERNVFQFDVSETGVKFRAMIFFNK
jgi:hypothetical protein